MTVDERLVETKKAFQNPEWYFQNLGYHVRIRIETVREFLVGTKCERILDIGCGDGSISLPLLTRDNSLTLLDMSDRMLALAQSKISGDSLRRVEIIKGDFMRASLKENSYDLIVCLGVLAYIDNLNAFLQKVSAVL